jgi:hypothetical protein
VPSPVPPRDRNVYMVGAGLSCAFRLPNTASLLSETIAFSTTPPGRWLQDEDFQQKLERAFRFFYPDARHAGFQPDVVDFFSALRTYLDVGAGLVGTGFGDAPELYRLLRRGIAHLLIERTRRSRSFAGFESHHYLTEMVQPGHIIITSNWDTVIEEFAALHNIPIRLTSRTRKFEPNEVALLKLHGSLDWCQGAARAGHHEDTDYSALKELQNPPRPYTHALPSDEDDLVRVRTTSGNAWQRVRSRSREPYMVTMATGKSDDLGPLREVWRDAYRALSRARTLEIVGYSMPNDDVEIRTILRTGLQRGTRSPTVLVRNPSPDVHHRVRSLLDRSARSDYLPIDGVH